MIRVTNAALRLFVRARPCALGPSNLRCFPGIPMPARAVVELEVALLRSGVLAARRKLQDERKLAVVLGVDRARLAFRLADHRRELLHTSTERLGEVGVLRRRPLESGPIGNELVEIRVGIGAVALGGLPRL